MSASKDLNARNRNTKNLKRKIFRTINEKNYYEIVLKKDGQGLSIDRALIKVLTFEF